MNLFLCRQPPGNRDDLADLLEMAAMAALFGQPSTLAFVGDGVLQLAPEKHSDAASGRTSNESRALVEEGMVPAWADGEALDAHGLGAGQLILPIRRTDTAGLRELLCRADSVTGW